MTTLNLKILFASAVYALVASITPAAEFEPAASASNQLGLDLIGQLARKEGAKNVLLSPFAIETALSLVFAGAEGETRAEMARVLHAPSDEGSLQSSLTALTTDLAEKSNEAIEWHVANRLYGQKNYNFRDTFLAQLKKDYGATLESVDFREAPEQARSAINSWVKAETREKISEIIPPDAFTNGTRLVLVDALYFKAPWEHVFDEHKTHARNFRLEHSKTIMVPTMQQVEELGYAKRRDFTAVGLPYPGGQLQLLILLPKAATGVDELARKLTPQLLAECANLPVRTINLFLPKLRLEGLNFQLGVLLRNLGMKTAFDQPRGSANFERMAPRKTEDYLGLSEVFHETYLALDEKTTEASAADAVVLESFGFSENPQKPPEIHVDHPFILAIQHRKSGACLFLGCIKDPRT